MNRIRAPHSHFPGVLIFLSLSISNLKEKSLFGLQFWLLFIITEGINHAKAVGTVAMHSHATSQLALPFLLGSEPRTGNGVTHVQDATPVS